MSQYDYPKVIAVLGATGRQGSGVVQSLLRKTQPAFSVLALTRDLDSASAQPLRLEAQNNERLQLETANVFDPDTLHRAFKGVHGVFAVTNYRAPGQQVTQEEDLQDELIAGRNIIKAAKSWQDCGVKYFLLSSLPNIAQASRGQFTKVFHFDHKSQIESWAKEELPATTILHPGLFYTNMFWPQYCRRSGDGIVEFCAPVPAEKSADWVDPAYDIGEFAADRELTSSQRFLLEGQRLLRRRPTLLSGPKISFSELATVFEATTSRPARFKPSTLHEWGATVSASAGAGFERDIRQMIEWITVAPDDKICYGTMDPDEDQSESDLGVRASTFQEWLERSGWTGPDDGVK
ncbi:hypothetical protein ANOM_011270 [Aspergillus nomiae NRRL 13137]|uniref:NmrA-like domain-containing protein n=1 Tax=Aspergillus nomiae NRRL (strain ATCC 15546 / NRRL 13137 / CBS 260.88 / M93) TaxID=1509407 RepID=A0A0L1IMA8_ASPN3|nr:uncharacterized protein ANOM_011270 [Aspergillus nomiae NRRL 13137]KNG80303.1 hypothetical protein ANOM_011270 [Aspergillus nomiae NRRL 13137]